MTIKKIKIWDLHIGDYFYLYEHCAEHCKRQVFERTFNKLWGTVVKTNCETLLANAEVFVKLSEAPLVEVWKEKTMEKTVKFSQLKDGDRFIYSGRYFERKDYRTALGVFPPEVEVLVKYTTFGELKQSDYFWFGDNHYQKTSYHTATNSHVNAVNRTTGSLVYFNPDTTVTEETE